MPVAIVVGSIWWERRGFSWRLEFVSFGVLKWDEKCLGDRWSSVGIHDIFNGRRQT